MASADATLYVPRIVPSDGSNAIWNAKQRSVIFWFGRVDSLDNYVQSRVGYSDELLMIDSAVFDQRIYDDATDDALDQWDSLTLLLDLDGDSGKTEVDEHSLRIDAQAHRQGTEQTFVYTGRSGQWVTAGIEPTDSPAASPEGINLVKGYRGEERDASRGWVLGFYLGWAALGRSGPPLGDTARGLRVAMIGYDRDDADGNAGGDPQYWPSGAIDPTDPSTWGRWELLDGEFLGWEESGSSPGSPQPSYAIDHAPEPYVADTETTVTIRDGLDGARVLNASAGASERQCSGDDAYNFGDGLDSWGGNTENEWMHVQNQGDVADWPCFARVYLKFPLDALPADAVVVSARLILHQKQPTSSGDEGEHSLIHAFPVASTLRDGTTEWTPDNLTWNDAPLAFENVAASWADRTNMDAGWDNLVELTWDVSRAVARAAGQGSISFAMYSSDTEYHTGKEFVRSEDFADWGDPSQRPTLEITCAEAQP